MGRSMVSKELLMDSVAMARHDTHYSNSRKFDDCDGTAIVKFTKVSAGSITITQQCSLDNENWYNPETASGAAGAVEASMTGAADKYISYTPVLCSFIRFKLHEEDTAATTVTLELIYRVEVN